MQRETSSMVSGSYVVLGNSLFEYARSLAMFLVVLLILWIVRKFIVLRLHVLTHKTNFELDDVLASAIKELSWPLYVLVALYFSVQRLVLATWVDKALTYALLLTLSFYAVRIIQHMTNFIISSYAKRQEDQEGRSLIMLLGRIVGIIIWAVAILLVLANFGIEITPLIASLGIGGIAIAFALQNILEDLFSSFTIYFDKPFRVGDFITIGSDSGIVEYVGLKSTRIRTLQGQELVVSNRELTNTRVENFKQMERRRILFTLGVEYATPVKKLQKINAVVKKIIENTDPARFGRSHFRSFGDSALQFEIVYYVDDPSYDVYLDTQQDINFAIVKAFEKEKISLAFPTQTVYVRK